MGTSSKSSMDRAWEAWVYCYSFLSNLTPAHIASVITCSERQASFEFWHGGIFPEDHWTAWNTYSPGGINVCKEYGHRGESYADPESGADSFQCQFCDFGYEVYM